MVSQRLCTNSTINNIFCQYGNICNYYTLDKYCYSCYHRITGHNRHKKTTPEKAAVQVVGGEKHKKIGPHLSQLAGRQMQTQLKPIEHFCAQKGIYMSSLTRIGMATPEPDDNGGKIIPFKLPATALDDKIAAMFQRDINGYCHSIRSHMGDYIAYYVAQSNEKAGKYKRYVDEDSAALLTYIIGQLNHKFSPTDIMNFFEHDIIELCECQASASLALTRGENDESSRLEAETTKIQNGIVARLLKLYQG